MNHEAPVLTVCTTQQQSNPDILLSHLF